MCLRHWPSTYSFDCFCFQFFDPQTVCGRPERLLRVHDNKLRLANEISFCFLHQNHYFFTFSIVFKMISFALDPPHRHYLASPPLTALSNWKSNKAVSRERVIFWNYAWKTIWKPKNISPALEASHPIFGSLFFKYFLDFTNVKPNRKENFRSKDRAASMESSAAIFKGDFFREEELFWKETHRLRFLLSFRASSQAMCASGIQWQC